MLHHVLRAASESVAAPEHDALLPELEFHDLLGLVVLVHPYFGFLLLVALHEHLLLERLVLLLLPLLLELLALLLVLRHLVLRKPSLILRVILLHLDLFHLLLLLLLLFVSEVLIKLGKLPLYLFFSVLGDLLDHTESIVCFLGFTSTISRLRFAHAVPFVRSMSVDINTLVSALPVPDPHHLEASLVFILKLVWEKSIWIDCSIELLITKVEVIGMGVFPNRICLALRESLSLCQKWISIYLLLKCKLSEQLGSSTPWTDTHCDLLNGVVHILLARSSQDRVWRHKVIHMN